MAVPKAPDDAELKNIIEKLAQFVARNGASFEAMTKTKQRDNPRFSFLFGGEGFDYYNYRVTTEQVTSVGDNRECEETEQIYRVCGKGKKEKI